MDLSLTLREGVRAIRKIDIEELASIIVTFLGKEKDIRYVRIRIFRRRKK